MARWALLVAVVAVLPYLQTLGHGFVFDDAIEVVHNAHVRSLGNLPQMFSSPAWSGAGAGNDLYRPLTTLSYALNHALGGEVPWSYHLVNVLLHAAVCLLLYRLARSWGLTGLAALAAALLFAVHPVHVEAVANVAGRKDVLATLFVLLALYAHRPALGRGGVWLMAPAAACALAFLSKETGAVALALMAIQDALTRPPATRLRRAVVYGAAGCVVMGLMAVRTVVLGGFGSADIPFVDNPLAHAPTGARLLTATAVLGRGLGLLIFPAALSPDYSHAAIPVLDSAAAPAFVLSSTALLLLAAAATAARRSAPVVTFSVVWYALAIAPAANILMPIGTMFGERLLYLPSIAVCTAAGFAFGKLPRVAACMLLAVVTVVLGARTASYAAVWASDASLFAAACEMSAKVQYNRGVLHKASGDPHAALRAYDRALAIHPRYAKAYANRGSLRSQLGDAAGALRDLNEALRLDPRDAFALNNRGLLHREAGRLGAAVVDLTAAIGLGPGDPLPYLNRGLAYERLGDAGRAVADYHAALRLAPQRWPHRSFALRQLERALAGTGAAASGSPRLPESP